MIVGIEMDPLFSLVKVSIRSISNCISIIITSEASSLNSGLLVDASAE
jgi:hypothetical protein